MTQKEYEEKYHGQVVKVVGSKYPEFKDRKGFVTAALLEGSNEGDPILAVWFENNEWCTFVLSDLSELDNFEIIN